MKSIKELYRIGTGPSSSHTMGPRKAAEIFLERHPEAASFKVTLYGSLAATGKGHMTNIADGQCSVSAAALWQKRMTEHPRSIHPMCIP